MSVECEEVRKIQNNHSIKSEEIEEMIQKWSQITSRRVFEPMKECGLYPKTYGKPFMCFKQKSEMIDFQLAQFHW